MFRSFLATLILSFASFSFAQPHFKGLASSSSYMCGYNHSSVSCWGSSPYGVLQDIAGFQDIKQVSAAQFFACALDELGVTCWGEAPGIPTVLSESSQITQIQTGFEQICGLVAGHLECNKLRPGAIPSHLNKIDQFAMNNGETCAVQDRVLDCWNEFGVTEHLTNIIKVEMNDMYKCVLTTAHTVKCFGGENHSRLQVPLHPRNIVNVWIASYHACFEDDLGQIICWGRTNPGPSQSIAPGTLVQNQLSYCGLDSLGNVLCGESILRNTPLPMLVKDIEALTLSEKNTCFLSHDEITCTGRLKIVNGEKVKNLTYLSSNYDSLCYIDELGAKCFNSYLNESFQIPSDIQNPKEFTMGSFSICAREEKGTVGCWGQGIFNGPPEQPPVDLKGAVKISGAGYHHCALTNQNEVICWGADEIPPTFSSQEKVVDIISGNRYSCALLEDDNIKCWLVKNESGINSILTPPTHLSGIKGLVSGENFACAYTSTEIYCWGDAPIEQRQPPRVKGHIKTVKAGLHHACFQDDERVKCWGQNNEGQFQFWQ